MPSMESRATDSPSMTRSNLPIARGLGLRPVILPGGISIRARSHGLGRGRIRASRPGSGMGSSADVDKDRGASGEPESKDRGAVV